MNPRFSIIMPLYNKERYVKKAVESVLSQTYRDFEVIIVDDGSTDNSANVVKDFIAQIDDRWIDDRLTIISQSNAGVAVARNRGVKKSEGEYVCFLDADDWWKPTWLEEMDTLITEYPDAGLYATNYVYYKPGKTHVALDIPRGYMNYPETYMRGAMPVTSITTCMPRKVFDEMGGFPVGIKLGEDFLLWAKTALHYKVAFCEKPLAYYNNDVPANMRATRNLHAPEHHMLFHLGEIEREIGERTSQATTGRGKPLQGIETTALQESWKALLDKLRVSGLKDYWLSDEYHAVAAEELKKIDWNMQSRTARKQYELPVWLFRAKRRFMQIGSYCKQKMLKLFY